MTSASILDISEIEDDEAPLPASGHSIPMAQAQNSDRGHAHLGQAQSERNQDSQSASQQRQAQFYLYNEDLNPQHRIPNVLSHLINSSPAQTLSAASGEQTSQSQSLGQRQLPAIDYKPTLAGLARATPSPYPEERTESQPFTPAGDPAGASKQSVPKANLGTLSGVYFPCVQNIFGVILFIRMVWIVGTAGVPTAFSLVFICCCVTLTTSISLSAIATNGIVPAGGPYFMISRSLGPECGGAVGTMFFLGTTVAGAMYITGAVEIMLNYLAPSWGLFGDFQRDVSIMYHNIRVYGTILLILVGLLVWIGVKFVSKLAPIALFCVLFSIFSIYAGIFINYNGRPDLMICVLGDRLVTLKDIPYEETQLDEQSQQQQQTFYGKNISKLSASEQATLYQLRRTKALCTFEKLCHIYCPNESFSQQQSSIRPPDLELQSSEQTGVEQQGAQRQATGIGESEQIAELFKRAPDMSNCDPYFRANKHRIHLEKAVPGKLVCHDTKLDLIILRPKARRSSSKPADIYIQD